MLTDKYRSLLDYGRTLSISDLAAREEGGKLKLSGTADYQLDKDLLWDKIKTYSDWQTEIAADVRVKNSDIYGIYTVKSGDTLSLIAKSLFGDPMRYPEIFNLNKDVLKNPDLIKAGQKLKLPNR
jgi:nucleoid-associated protein YgaU